MAIHSDYQSEWAYHQVGECRSDTCPDCEQERRDEEIREIGRKTHLLFSITPISPSATIDRVIALYENGLKFAEAVDLLIDEYSYGGFKKGGIHGA